MTASIHCSLRTLMAIALALSPLWIAGCGYPETPDTQAEEARAASVRVALTAEHAALANEIELEFTPAEGGEGLSDTFGVDDPALVTRNYRLAPGDYSITAVGRNADGDTVLEGAHDRVTVEPGNNDLSLILRPTGEDLGDLYVALESPDVQIGFVSVNGDAREGTAFAAKVQVQLRPGGAMPSDLRVDGTIYVEGPEGELPLMEVPFAADAEDPLVFRAEAPADWLGAARLDLRVQQDGGLADRSTKQINGHPSEETQALIAALARQLQANEDGTLAPVLEPVVAGNMVLEGEGLDALNEGIDRMNQLALESGNPLLPGVAAIPLVYAAMGYWACVAKVLKCELLTAGCIAAAPAAVIACGEVCVGTLGLGCVACVVAAAGGVVALCDSALACWQEAKKEGCIP